MACVVQPCSAWIGLCTSGGSGVPDLIKSLPGACLWGIWIPYWFVVLWLWNIWLFEELVFVLLLLACDRRLFSVRSCSLCVSVSAAGLSAFPGPRLLPSEWLNFSRGFERTLLHMAVLSVCRTHQATSRGLCFRSRDLRFQGERTIR